MAFLVAKIFNSLPRFKGKLRLAKLLIANKNQKRSFITPNGLRYSIPNLIENVSFELYVNGIYEEETIEHICDVVPKNGVFIDVGANIGAICIEVAARRPDITVFAFEASPKVYLFLKENLNQNNLSNLKIFNLAVHEFGGIQLPFYSPTELNGKGSFAPVFTKIAEQVTTVRLDDFFAERGVKPNYIKIDVEGFEYQVLKSMETFLTQNTTCEVLFEFVDWAEIAAGIDVGAAQIFLRNLGYDLFEFNNNKLKNAILVSGFEMIIAKKKKTTSIKQ